MRTLLASLAICLLVPVPAHSQTVGMLGDWQKIEFEGLQEVDEDEIRHALAGDLEYQAAARPSASLEEFLKITKDRITQGFRHSGFVTTKVEVSHDAKRDRIMVLVDESRRLTAGEVKVASDEHIDSDKLAAAITTARPARKWLYWWGPGKNANREETNPEALWTKGEVIRLDRERISQLVRETWVACADMGSPFAQPIPFPAVHQESGANPLEIVVKGDTKPAHIDKIVINGLSRHSEAEVLGFLEISPGMAFTADVADRVYQRLRDSCRFGTTHCKCMCCFTKEKLRPNVPSCTL